MNKQELFKKYSIDESHNVWDNRIDNWMSVEVYRLMHDGKLPSKDDLSINWVTNFLDKINNTDYGIELMNTRDDFGSLYLTSKRMVYRHHEEILKEWIKGQ